MSDGSRGGQGPAPAELQREIELLRAENTRLRELLGTEADAVRSSSPDPTPSVPIGGLTLFEDGAPRLAQVDVKCSAEAKIALFRALFAGRDDVYAIRWDNPRTMKSGWSPAVVGGPTNAKRPDREYLHLTDAVVEAHLSGRIHVGVYPLLPDDSCRLLAVVDDRAGAGGRHGFRSASSSLPSYRAEAAAMLQQRVLEFLATR